MPTIGEEKTMHAIQAMPGQLKRIADALERLADLAEEVSASDPDRTADLSGEKV